MESSNKKSTELPEEIKIVKHHQKLAFKYLSKALDIDEGGEKVKNIVDVLVPLYEKGVYELQQGVLYELEGEGSEWDKGRALQLKMQRNLADSISRLDELSKLPKQKDPNSSASTSSLKDTTKRSQPISTKTSTGKGVGRGSVKLPGGSIQNGKTSYIPKPRPSSATTTRGITKSHSHPQPKSTRPASATVAKPTPRLPNAEQEKKISNMKNVDSKLANMILNDVIERDVGITFDDIGGAENAKQALREIVILPSLRPELFTGLRVPARGVLLFGPPGNGKTMLAKAVASEANSVFFNISAASLTSKYVGEGEKMVQALFAVAREVQPAIIFIDEVDSLLTERKENENEASRRLKTEFLLCFDGVASDPNERILVMGATNRPWELDDAALRRLVKRVYLPLPNDATRHQILDKLLAKQRSPLSQSDLTKLSRMTDGYSGSDLAALARDAALMPIREMNPEVLRSLPADKVRRINVNDFELAMKSIRPSVSEKYLKTFNEWNSGFGSL